MLGCKLFKSRNEWRLQRSAQVVSVKSRHDYQAQAKVTEKSTRNQHVSSESGQDRGVIELNLAGVDCPMNFVKTKLQLDKMAAGEQLTVILDDGEPLESVQSSLEQEGHKVAEPCRLTDGLWRLDITKA